MAITSMTETERKYDVDESVQIPSLSGFGTVEFSEPVTLRAVYFDTADGALASRLITLRRRTGGKDEGWHVKTPGTDGRTEHHAPLDDPTGSDNVPPAGILDLVRALVRRQELGQVARLTTERTIAVILNEAGEPSVEIADDLVSATDVHSGILRIWREWEAELLEGAPEGRKARTALLDSVEEALLQAGAVPAASASKLARATGRTSLARAAAASTLGKDSTALAVASAVIDDLTGALLRADPAVRADEPDSVHTMRTLVRRLRGVLAAFRGVLDSDVTDPLRERLRLFGDVLAGARDSEVRRNRATTLLDGFPPADSVDQDDTGTDASAHGDDRATENVTDAADAVNPRADAVLRRRLVDDALGEYGSHLTEVYDFLNSTTYFTLLDDLELLVRRPPVTEASLLPAKAVLRDALKRQARRARRRLKRADQTDLEQLHEARKAARRVRYVAEALGGRGIGLFGSKVDSVGRASEAVQDVIGEHRDTVLFLEHIERVSEDARQAGESTGGYFVLAEQQRLGAADALRDVPGAIATFRKRT